MRYEHQYTELSNPVGGEVLAKQYDEWQVCRRHFSVKSWAHLGKAKEAQQIELLAAS